MGKLVKHLVDNLIFLLLQARVEIRIPPDLKQQAFTQVAGTDTGRVKTLQFGQDLFQFLLGGIHAIVDFQFIRYRGKFLFQQPVALQ